MRFSSVFHPIAALVPAAPSAIPSRSSIALSADVRVGAHPSSRRAFDVSMTGELVATSYQPGVSATTRLTLSALTTARISFGLTPTARAPTTAASAVLSSTFAAML
jgi:hypothetical protein